MLVNHAGRTVQEIPSISNQCDSKSCSKETKVQKTFDCAILKKNCAIWKKNFEGISWPNHNFEFSVEDCFGGRRTRPYNCSPIINPENSIIRETVSWQSVEKIRFELSCILMHRRNRLKRLSLNSVGTTVFGANPEKDTIRKAEYFKGISWKSWIRIELRRLYLDATQSMR